jgi:excisionase family DNA binding protein
MQLCPDGFGWAREDAPVEQLISIDEAARRLGGLSRFTIESWLSKGKLQRVKVGSRTMLYESSLQTVVKDGGKSPSPRRREK